MVLAATLTMIWTLRPNFPGSPHVRFPSQHPPAPWPEPSSVHFVTVRAKSTEYSLSPTSSGELASWYPMASHCKEGSHGTHRAQYYPRPPRPPMEYLPRPSDHCGRACPSPSAVGRHLPALRAFGTPGLPRRRTCAHSIAWGRSPIFHSDSALARIDSVQPAIAMWPAGLPRCFAPAFAEALELSVPWIIFEGDT